MFKFRFVVGVLFLLSGKVSFAQTDVRLQEPMPGNITLNSLWNLEISNTGGNRNVYIMGHISFSGKALYHVTFQPVSVSDGVSFYNANQLVIRDQVFTTESKAEVIRNSGIIPFGNYTVCVQMYDAQTNIKYNDYCIEHNVEAFTPPMLLSPADGAVVTTVTPFLMWIPPSPFNSFDNLLYDIRVVEILGQQSKEEAVNRNYAVLEQKGLNYNQLLYPATALPLQEHKDYAWQIKARNGNYIIGLTEVWKFRIERDSISEKTKVIPNDPYTRLRSSLDGSYCIAAPELRFSHYNQNTSGNVKYEIRDLKGNPQKNAGGEFESVFGDNRFSIDLASESKLKNGEFYVLEFTDIKGGKSFLMFQFYKSETHFRKKQF